MRRDISTEKVAQAPHILSQAIESNGFLFVSGQIDADTEWKLVDGGVAEQTRKALENIKLILEAAGAGMDDIVKVTIYVTDIADGKIINEVYSSYFNEPLPAREMVGVKELPLGASVEISIIALASN